MSFPAYSGLRNLILAALGLASLPSFAADPFLVVSDVDDTLKITHVDDPLNSVIRGLFGNRAFSGMPELFRGMANDYPDTRFFYLTYLPGVMGPRTREFLKDNRFPSGALIMRGARDPKGAAEYKFERLERLAREHKGQFILFGDDTQADTHAYYTFFLAHPDRVAEIYIRQVNGFVLPPAVHPFTTAFDVARYEFEFGRLGAPSAVRVGQRILDEKKDRAILPRWLYCPVTYAPAPLDEELARMKTSVDERVAEICKSR